MTKKVLCLFFFCLLLMSTGCENRENGVDTDNNQLKEILVLTDGKKETEEVAEIICDKMGAVHMSITDSTEEDLEMDSTDQVDKRESLETAIQKADLILIGTRGKTSELEFLLKSRIDKDWFKGKEISFYFIDQEKEAEKIEEPFGTWYPEAELLSTFTMSMKQIIREEEIGRMNGWLTSVNVT